MEVAWGRGCLLKGMGFEEQHRGLTVQRKSPRRGDCGAREVSLGLARLCPCAHASLGQGCSQFHVAAEYPLPGGKRAKHHVDWGMCARAPMALQSSKGQLDGRTIAVLSDRVAVGTEEM